MNNDQGVLREILRQARLVAHVGAAQLQDEVRGALGQTQGQMAKMSQDQLNVVNGADPAAANPKYLVRQG